MNKLNKDAIIKRVAQNTDFTIKNVTEVVDNLFDTIGEALVDGNTVKIVGFGTFEVRERECRIGVNPQTRERMEIAPTKTPAFKASTVLKTAVKGR